MDVPPEDPQAWATASRSTSTTSIASSFASSSSLSSTSSLASSWYSKTSRAGETQDFGVDEGSGTENTSWKWRRREASQDGDRCVERDDRLRQGAYVAVRRFIPVRRSLDIRARYQLHGPERKGRGPVAAGSSEKASPRPFTEPVHSN